MGGFDDYALAGGAAVGPTGAVSWARHLPSGQAVAVTELTADVASDTTFVTRLGATVGVLASVRHPNVLPVREVVEEPGRVWVVEDWVDGRELGEVVADGPLRPEQAALLGCGVLRGLAAVHGRGIVHGDVSPASIVISGAGVPRLVGFGFAGMPGRPPADARGDLQAVVAVLRDLLAESTSSVRHKKLDGVLAKGKAGDAAGLLATIEKAARSDFGKGWEERASLAGLVATPPAPADVVATVVDGRPAEVDTDAGLPVTGRDDQPAPPEPVADATVVFEAPLAETPPVEPAPDEAAAAHLPAETPGAEPEADEAAVTDGPAGAELDDLAEGDAADAEIAILEPDDVDDLPEGDAADTEVATLESDDVDDPPEGDVADAEMATVDPEVDELSEADAGEAEAATVERESDDAVGVEASEDEMAAGDPGSDGAGGADASPAEVAETDADDEAAADAAPPELAAAPEPDESGGDSPIKATTEGQWDDAVANVTALDLEPVSAPTDPDPTVEAPPAPIPIPTPAPKSAAANRPRPGKRPARKKSSGGKRSKPAGKAPAAKTAPVPSGPATAAPVPGIQAAPVPATQAGPVPAVPATAAPAVPAKGARRGRRPQPRGVVRSLAGLIMILLGAGMAVAVDRNQASDARVAAGSNPGVTRPEGDGGTSPTPGGETPTLEQIAASDITGDWAMTLTVVESTGFFGTQVGASVAKTYTIRSDCATTPCTLLLVVQGTPGEYLLRREANEYVLCATGPQDCIDLPTGAVRVPNGGVASVVVRLRPTSATRVPNGTWRASSLTGFLVTTFDTSQPDCIQGSGVQRSTALGVRR